MIYHYACRHSAAKILAMPTPTVVPAGLLQPERFQTSLGKVLGSVAWFTDLDTPMRDALGLSSTVLDCDRTERRFRVVEDDEALLTPWFRWRRTHPTEIWEILEASPGAMPVHWWVANQPVRVVEA